MVGDFFALTVFLLSYRRRRIGRVVPPGRALIPGLAALPLPDSPPFG